MDQKIIACLLYDFKSKKSHRSLAALFGRDVVTKRQYERWFQRFTAGDNSPEDEEHDGRQAPILDNDLSRTAVDADPTKSTRELVVEFLCSKSTFQRHFHEIGISNCCGRWVPHLQSDPGSACINGQNSTSPRQEFWIYRFHRYARRKMHSLR